MIIFRISIELTYLVMRIRKKYDIHINFIKKNELFILLITLIYVNHVIAVTIRRKHGGY